jgi:hypothetical protein
MERLERRPKSGNGDKVYVTFRATGWHGVENALLTSTIQATPYKEQNNLFRGQCKFLTDHTGAYFKSPIAINGPQGESRAEALRKLEVHYNILAAWVFSEFGDGDEEVSGVPPAFIKNYKAAFNRVVNDDDDAPVKRRKLNAVVAVSEEEPPVLTLSEQAMQLALEALSRVRAMAPAVVPAPPTSPTEVVEPVRILWSPPPLAPLQVEPTVEAPKVVSTFVAAKTVEELDARIARREQMLYDPFGAGEASSLNSEEASELFSLFF